jgi:DNA polymerase I-like protein with 3'-5' exonuclease and polymerase domains
MISYTFKLHPRENDKPFRPSFKMDLMAFNQPRPDLIETMGQLKEQTNDTFIFDMETDGLLDECTKIHCIALTTPNGDTSLFAQDDVPMALHHLANAECIVGHNIIGFDIPVIKKLYPKWQTQARVRDTLVMSRLAYPNLMDTDYIAEKIPKQYRGSHSLKAWGYRLDTLKGKFSHEDTDWSEYTLDMGDYCVQDTVVTLHLASRLNDLEMSNRSIVLEHEFATNLVQMERNGVGFDTEACAKLYGELLSEKDKVLKEIAKVFPPITVETKTIAYWLDAEGNKYRIKSDATYNIRQALTKGPLKTTEKHFNPNSRQQIAEAFIDKHGWKPTEFSPTGKPRVDEDVLSGLDYPEAELIARYMMLCKRIGQVAEGDNAWLKLEKNGRMHGRINHNGALSGRCTHSAPNMSQVPAVRAEFGTACRSIFNVRKGYKMVGADMSGLELRCLAHYMHDWDDGEYVNEILSGDIHTLNQWAAGLDTRDQAKTFIYAFLYGAGNAKIGEIVERGEGAGRALRGRFLKSIPALNSLIKEVKGVASKRGWLRGVDGRKLPVRSQHSALNLLMQSTGAILMKQATVNLMKAIDRGGLDAKLVLHVHDEVQLEVKESQAELVGQLAVSAMIHAGKQFKIHCPMDGEYKLGNNWAETH